MQCTLYTLKIVILVSLIFSIYLWVSLDRKSETIESFRNFRPFNNVGSIFREHVLNAVNAFVEEQNSKNETEDKPNETDDKPLIPDYNFDTTVNIPKGTVNIFEKSTFSNGVAFNNNENITLDGSLHLNEDSSIYFDANKRFQKKDIIDIKKAISKKTFIEDANESISRYTAGELKSTFSTRNGGNDKCTSTIWDILMGRLVYSDTLCKSCCQQNNKNIIIQCIIKTESVTKSIIVDISKYQKFSLVYVTDLLDKAVLIKGSNILLYRSFNNIKCRLVLLPDDSELRNLYTMNDNVNINKYIINKYRRSISVPDSRFLKRLSENIYEIDLYYNINIEQTWGTFTEQGTLPSSHTINRDGEFEWKWVYLEYLE